ncbi:hypothetical protein C8J57DRAFT_1533836 [Mycena rebaudengoi]|nr:hypothetical protein C8J57DRAFT_1533836 [Mycena rebaudengoi]
MLTSPNIRFWTITSNFGPPLLQYPRLRLPLPLHSTFSHVCNPNSRLFYASVAAALKRLLPFPPLRAHQGNTPETPTGARIASASSSRPSIHRPKPNLVASGNFAPSKSSHAQLHSISVYMRGLSRLLLPMRRPRRSSQPFPPASSPLQAPPRSPLRHVCGRSEPSHAGLRGSRIANNITIGASDNFQLAISPAVSTPPLPLLRSSSPSSPHVPSCNPHVDIPYLSCPPPATYSHHNTYFSGNIICEHCSLLCYAPLLPAPVLSLSSSYSLYPSLRSARSFRPFLTFAPPLVWGGGLASLASHLWSCRSGWVEWFARLHHHS